MRDQSLLYWGFVVTMFVLIAAMLSARELIDIYFEKRRQKREDPGSDDGSDTA